MRAIYDSTNEIIHIIGERNWIYNFEDGGYENVSAVGSLQIPPAGGYTDFAVVGRQVFLLPALGFAYDNLYIYDLDSYTSLLFKSKIK